MVLSAKFASICRVTLAMNMFVRSYNGAIYGSPLPPDMDMGCCELDNDPGDDMYDLPPPPLSSPPPLLDCADEECSPMSRLSAISALLDMFPCHQAGLGEDHWRFECPFGGLGVFRAQADATKQSNILQGDDLERVHATKKRKMMHEDDLDCLAIQEARRVTSPLFSFARRCKQTEYEPAPASFVRIFIVAFLISRFGDQEEDMCRVRKYVLSEELACFFGLAANDLCVGMSCEEVVAGVGASWPRSAYRGGAVHDGLEVRVHSMQGSLAGLEEQFQQGHATPLLYCTGRHAKGAPYFRAMALQLLIAGGDKALPHKGYRFGSAPWEARVVHPLLRTQVLCLHPHLRFYAALLTYVPEVSLSLCMRSLSLGRTLSLSFKPLGISLPLSLSL